MPFTRSRSVWCAAAIAALGFFGWSVRLPAAPVFSAIGPWQVSPTQPPNVISPPASGVRTFSAYGTGNWRVGQAKGWAQAGQGGNAIVFSEIVQSFSLDRAAVVQLPRYVHGNIGFSGNANATGLADVEIAVLDDSNNVVYIHNPGTLNATASGGNASWNTAGIGTVNLPIGDYRVRVSLTVNATVAGNAGASDTATTDFYGGFLGGATVLGGWPQGLTGSRGVVRAPQARSTYGVNGAGVKVGVLEPGRPFIASDWAGVHSSLAGRISLVNLPTSNLTGYRSEHAQAVASVIASANPDSEKAGMAPAASIVAAPFSTYAGAPADWLPAVFNDLVNAGARIVNMSAFIGDDPMLDPDNLAAVVDTILVNNPTLLFVKSAGNTSDGNTQGGVTTPGHSYATFAVGGLDENHVGRYATSSFGSITPARNPFKPDIVAPGEYVEAASVFSTHFSRAMVGENFELSPTRPNIGAFTGTSFAAPHVSGIAALLHEYANARPTTHEIDRRVIKAVMMNAANRDRPKRYGGGNWQQVSSGLGTISWPLLVERSLDPQLGAGMVDAYASLRQFAAAEVRAADGHGGNAGEHFLIDARNAGAFWWDKQAVATDQASVDYLLGDLLGGTIEATLNWDPEIGPNGLRLAQLELRVYLDSPFFGAPGYNPEDYLLAQAIPVYQGDWQNVLLFDFNVVPFELVLFEVPWPVNVQPNVYLSVWNNSNFDATYGLAVHAVPIPEPGLLLVFLPALALLARRRL